MQGNATTSFTFKVGSGTVAAEDDISVTIDGIGTTALTLSGSTVSTRPKTLSAAPKR